jgi:four helix bundle protein
MDHYKNSQKTKTFEELEVWKKAHEFVLQVYKSTDGYPKSEVYGLTSQFRRAAISIAANIAEGYKKKGIRDKLRFYNISQGSLEECRYFILLSKDLDLISEGTNVKMVDLLNHTSFLLNSYCNAILTKIK